MRWKQKKSVFIVQLGNWLKGHKHTSWITQESIRISAVCVWFHVGLHHRSTAKMGDRTRGKHCYYFTTTTLDWFTFWPRLETFFSFNQLGSSVVWSSAGSNPQYRPHCSQVDWNPPGKLKKKRLQPPRIDLIFHLIPPTPILTNLGKNCIDHTAWDFF